MKKDIMDFSSKKKGGRRKFQGKVRSGWKILFFRDIPELSSDSMSFWSMRLIKDSVCSCEIFTFIFNSYELLSQRNNISCIFWLA